MQGLNKQFIDENCIEIIQKISDDDFYKIKAFCEMNNHKFLNHMGFVDYLDDIRQGVVPIEKQERLACYVLMHLLLIQDCIDDFNKISLDIL